MAFQVFPQHTRTSALLLKFPLVICLCPRSCSTTICLNAHKVMKVPNFGSISLSSIKTTRSMSQRYFPSHTHTNTNTQILKSNPENVNPHVAQII